MDYNKLKTLTVVGELGSITAAAHKLHRSQSAISQQILALEKELNIKLLERKAGSVILSKDGQDLFQLAKTTLGKIDDYIATIYLEKNEIQGHLRLGILNDNSVNINLEHTIAKYCLENPNVNLSFYFGTNDEIEKGLISNKFDIGFMVFFQQAELFARTPLSKFYHKAYTSSSYLRKIGRLKSYRDILDANLIDITPDFACLKTWYKKNCPKLVSALSHRRPDIVLPDHKKMAQTVAAGYGIALLPDFIVKNSGYEKHLQEIVTSSKPVITGLDAAYRTNKTLRACEKLFLNEVQQTRKSLSLGTNEKG